MTTQKTRRTLRALGVWLPIEWLPEPRHAGSSYTLELIQAWEMACRWSLPGRARLSVPAGSEGSAVIFMDQRDRHGALSTYAIGPSGRVLGREP